MIFFSRRHLAENVCVCVCVCVCVWACVCVCVCVRERGLLDLLEWCCGHLCSIPLFTLQRVGLQSVIVAFTEHAHLIFLTF